MPSARRGFVLLCAATYAQFVAMGIFLSALPLYITRSLDGSRSDVGLAVGAFSLSAVLLRPIVGRGIDRRGRRPYLFGGPALLAVSSAGLFAASSIPLVVALRLIQGVSGACYYTAGATVATDMAPPNRRADYIARFSLFLYGGFATGPALGEFLVGRWGFDAAWGVALGSAATAALVSRLVPETLADHVEEDGDVVEPVARRRIAQFLHPAALGPGFVIMNAAVGYVAISTFSPLYAREIGMDSSGPLYVVFALTVLAVRLFAGRLADVHGRVKVALPALVIGATAFALLAAQPPPALAYVGVAGFGSAFALLFPALMALAVDRVREPERGAVLGSFTACFDIGASGGSYALGTLADHFGFGWAYCLPVVTCLLGLGALGRIALRAKAEDDAADSGGVGHRDDPPLPEPAGT